MKRAYLPINKDPKFNPYHEAVDRFMNESQIMNAGRNNRYIFWDKNALTSELLSLIGDGTETFKKNGKTTNASIPYFKNQLKELNDKWKTICDRKVAEGRTKPPEWPKEMLKERLELEARILVCEEEATILTKKLADFQDKETAISNSKVLQHGPKGSGRMKAGFLIEIDGMKVSLNEERIPFINDSRAGQYNGYSCADYYQYIVKPWGIARAELMKKTQQEIAAGKLSATVPNGLKTGTSAPWPTFPENVKPIVKRK